MSYIVEKSFERLMPEGWCWNGARNGSIKEMTDGLSVQVDRDRIDGKNIIRDYYPYQTEMIEEWEQTLALPPLSTLTVDQRRKRIQATRSGLATNTFSGQAQFINLSGFNVKCIPLEEAQNPSILTSVLEVVGDGRYDGLGFTFTQPVDSDYFTLLYIIESVDGSPIAMTSDEYDVLRFLILKTKPPFMWAIVRGIIV